MSERNKRTPWDEELQAQVLADEQSKRDKAKADQLETFEKLSAGQDANPASKQASVGDAEAEKIMEQGSEPAPEPEKPALGIEVDSSTFADEDSAVNYFEQAFAPGTNTDGIWTRLENYFGAKELRLYIGFTFLIVVVLMFSLWFKTSATGIKAAKRSLDKNKATVQEGIENATGTEPPE